ncbi:uncharacterized protein ACRADG_007789 [Cochliomyia hominivorax]
MIKLMLIKLFVILFLFTIIKAVPDKKTWTYELTSVTTKSSDPDLLDITFIVERISRGVFALSGGFNVNMDVEEGDENEIELTSYRSANHDGNYKSIPLEMSRRHFYDAFNTHYKTVVMETFKDCSDMPYFEDTMPIPIEKKNYVLNKCRISQEGMPNHLEIGTYKLLLTGYGAVEWEIEIIAGVEESND